MKKFIKVQIVTDDLYVSYPAMEYKRIDGEADGNIYLGVETEDGTKYSIPHRLIKEILTWTEEETTAEK